MADYNALQITADVGANKSDDYFRGLGFGTGRQGAMDYLAHQRQAMGGITAEEKANYQREQYDKAIKPAVTSLEAGIPEIATRYETARQQAGAEKQPTRDRYQRLIDEIRGQGEGEKTSTIKTAAREFGRRGIPLSSTSYAEEEQGRVNPITKYYLSKEAEATDAETASIRQIDNLVADLTGQEVDSVRAVRNAIAQLQANSGMQAVSTANTLMESSLDRILQQAQLQLQERQLSSQERQSDISSSLEQRKFDEAIRQFNLELAEKQKTGSTSGSSTGTAATKSALAQLNELIGSNAVPSGSEKSAAWKYIHALEPSAGALGLHMPTLWATYNAL